MPAAATTTESALDVAQGLDEPERRHVAVAVAAEREIEHVVLREADDRLRDPDLVAVALAVEHLRDVDGRARRALQDDAGDERPVARLVVEPAVGRAGRSAPPRRPRPAAAGVEPLVEPVRDARVEDGDLRPRARAGLERDARAARPGASPAGPPW